MTDAERKRAARVQRRLAGLCLDGCGAPALPGRTRCAKHLARMTHYAKRYYAQNAAEIIERNNANRWKPRPPYERPEIPYERETELPMLCKMVGMFVCLDEPLPDEYDDFHDRFDATFSGTALTPLELLIIKEWRESPEGFYWERNMEQWLEWWERKAA